MDHEELKAAIAASVEQPHIQSHLKRKGWLHIHDLVTAFAVGVLTADPWTKNYRPPPNLEKVLGHVAKRVCETFSLEVVEITIHEVETFYWLWGEECPEFKGWNVCSEHPPEADCIHGTSRYSATPEKRNFIDLHALVRNATNYLSRQWDREEAFDREFRAEHPEHYRLANPSEAGE